MFHVDARDTTGTLRWAKTLRSYQKIRETRTDLSALRAGSEPLFEEFVSTTSILEVNLQVWDHRVVGAAELAR